MSHCCATSSYTLPTMAMSNVTVGFLVALQVMLRWCATGKKLVRTSQACAKHFDAGFGQLRQCANSPCTGVQFVRSVFAQCSRPLGGYSRCDLGILALRPMELLHTRSEITTVSEPIAVSGLMYQLRVYTDTPSRLTAVSGLMYKYKKVRADYPSDTT